MTTDQMKERIQKLQEMAKQHEAVLLQISGAIQEYTRVVAEEESQAMGADYAADQVNDA
jgi:hypothetical protein